MLSSFLGVDAEVRLADAVFTVRGAAFSARLKSCLARISSWADFQPSLRDWMSSRAFSLLLCTGECGEVRLFLRKSRVGIGCSVCTRSENALAVPDRTFCF